MFFHPTRLSADKHDKTDDYTCRCVFTGYMYCAVNRTSNSQKWKLIHLSNKWKNLRLCLFQLSKPSSL